MDLSWTERAACRDLDTELFFPDHGSPGTAAKAVCARCPVMAECRAFHDELEGPGHVSNRFGIVGGESSRERVRRRAGRAPVARTDAFWRRMARGA